MCGKIRLGIAFSVIGMVYVPPKAGVPIYRQVIQLISELKQLGGDKDQLLIFGDLNLPNFKWMKDNEISLLFGAASDRDRKFVDGIRKLWIAQVNCISNFYGRFLDLVISKKHQTILVEECASFVKTEIYHTPIAIEISQVTSTPNFPQYQSGHPNFRFFFHINELKQLSGDPDQVLIVSDFNLSNLQ